MATSQFGVGRELVLFKANLLRALGAAAVQHVKPATHAASKTLAKFLSWEVDRVASSAQRISIVRIMVPYYWARWLHDGRGSIVMSPPPSRRTLVWYRDHSQDPRFSARPWPVRRDDWRHLTHAEFKRDFAQGKIIVAYAVGPTTPKKFFSMPMETFPRKADTIVRDAFTAFLKKNVLIRDRGSVVLTI